MKDNLGLNKQIEPYEIFYWDGRCCITGYKLADLFTGSRRAVEMPIAKKKNEKNPLKLNCSL